MRKRGRKAKCIYCGSSNTIGRGVRHTSRIGDRKLRSCKRCNRKFTVGRLAPNTEPQSGEVSHQAEPPIEL